MGPVGLFRVVHTRGFGLAVGGGERLFDPRVEFDCKSQKNFYKTLFWIVRRLGFGPLSVSAEFRRTEFPTKRRVPVIVVVPTVCARIRFRRHCRGGRVTNGGPRLSGTRKGG